VTHQLSSNNANLADWISLEHIASVSSYLP